MRHTTILSPFTTDTWRLATGNFDGYSNAAATMKTEILGDPALSGFLRRPPYFGGGHYRRVREMAGFAEFEEFLERYIEGFCDDFELFRFRK